MASFCPFRITTSMTRIFSFSKTTFADFGATFRMCSTKSCSGTDYHLRYFKVRPRLHMSPTLGEEARSNKRSQCIVELGRNE